MVIDVIFINILIDNYIFLLSTGEVFDYLVAHGRMKEKEARAKFRQVSHQYRIAHASVVIPLLFFERRLHAPRSSFITDCRGKREQLPFRCCSDI